jgi:hypothetical protein
VTAQAGDHAIGYELGRAPSAGHEYRELVAAQPEDLFVRSSGSCQDPRCLAEDIVAG